MHVADPCVGVLTNLEVLALLRQQQRRLPSLQSLLLSHSSSSSSSGYSRQHGGESEKGAASSPTSDPAAEGACEVLRPETVKAYLYQHMLNHTLQEYIHSTCPYLSLLDSSPQERLPAEKGVRDARPRVTFSAPQSRGSHRQDENVTPVGPSHNAPATEGSDLRQIRSVSCLGGGPSPMVTRGLQKLLGRRFFSCVGPCLEVLSLRYGLYQAELLQMLNLGASKPVEIYAIVEECAIRLSENEVNEILEAIQHYWVEHNTTPLPYSAGGTGTLAPWPPSSQLEHGTGALGSGASSAAASSSSPGGANGSALLAPQDGRSNSGQDASFADLARGPEVSLKPSKFPPTHAVSPLLGPRPAGRLSDSSLTQLGPDETQNFLQTLEMRHAGEPFGEGENTASGGLQASTASAEATPRHAEEEETEPQDDSRGARRGRRGAKKATSSSRKPRSRSAPGSRKRLVTAGEAEDAA
ncbi:DNA-directed RNA polymerase III RPC9 [Toxoplasma gondii p89]|uniref:DNA-directed RNA polymerase III subunit RPC9 n=1 Tax=Toxoplasma gondii p89 TaxID=943119 RepID=A0A086KR19_TOXGO|nr:DNA-directed RNA polymerase III RPC9 [Toxoplasma gondii p89]